MKKIGDWKSKMGDRRCLPDGRQAGEMGETTDRRCEMPARRSSGGGDGSKDFTHIYYLLSAFFICYLLSAVFTGCQSTYTPAHQVLPENIRKIAIETFKNSTVYYGMEDKLTIDLTDEFIRDGRLAVVNSASADGILRGQITRYVLEPLTYDENHVVLEYKLWILIDISLIDRVKNEVIFQEKNLEGSYRYFVENILEEEARELIWEKFARKILKRTIEGFGAVTGISEKKVPLKKIPLLME